MKELISGKSKALVLIAITYAFAKFQGGFASWFLFYSCLVFLAYEVLAFSLMFTGLEVEREIDRSRLQEGEDVIVTVRLKRRIWFPLGWNMVIEPLPERLAGVYEPHRQLVFPWFKRSVEFRYVIPGLPRGYYHLEACVISGGDFFGFIERRRTFPLSNDLLVYPRYRELNSWSLGDGNFSGTIHVSHRYSDDVAAVRGVRDYQRGDRMSQIHWRASARGTGLKTKEFEHQAMNQVVFFLDVEKEHYQNKPFQLFETAVKLTASQTAYANRNQYHYGLVYKQKDRVAIPPACSPTHFFRVFDQLARVMPEGTDSFVRILRREALEQPPGVTLTVITACLDKELVDLLTRLSHRGRRVQLLYVHDDPLLSLDEKQALRLLASGRVTCKAVPMSDVEEWKRIGGA
ncbi:MULTISPECIES: DUF58 domain-containing protein [Bacillales]|jgi:uncharacterized protein (DUF58 family)|uniref:DUF58 domain-containing protein n=1 Tax=Brevibacillus aydinogluensis TaxID=927786 RepID=A0AA48RDQ9_9BACL|nr:MULTISPECIES: DUF58 domain-containing protein [Bacillales]REK63516.1 MAG: DUF58 domain-containing protein [Brevibacillus sp.]MDT3418215.1 uncharacterized protein (DUF58 family) [Brevibacillus aydinogluensis]NNV04594.1 DUF58 domain-containing protein [Brevibacillus sp. MCWH]UFJ62610.1 DUF58 domain-containing protein [Anoxybacillus sediminis]CAJ1004270.1 DUF58 domain-containing protein [Brevibacillus aydinogluensis]